MLTARLDAFVAAGTLTIDDTDAGGAPVHRSVPRRHAQAAAVHGRRRGPPEEIEVTVDDAVAMFIKAYGVARRAADDFVAAALCVALPSRRRVDIERASPTAVCSHRLAVQDVALSRRKLGFDSPWERQRNQRFTPHAGVRAAVSASEAVQPGSRRYRQEPIASIGVRSWGLSNKAAALSGECPAVRVVSPPIWQKRRRADRGVETTTAAIDGLFPQIAPLQRVANSDMAPNSPVLGERREGLEDRRQMLRDTAPSPRPT